MVQFAQVPASVRVPGTYVEFDASRAQQGLGTQAYRILVLGQMLSTGSADALTPLELYDADGAAAAFGHGSMLHAMAGALFANDKSVRAVFVGLEDAVGATKSTGTVTVTASSPKGGTVYLYVGGRRFAVAVTTASTASSIASSIAAAVNADTAAQVTASATAAVVTLTAKQAGTIGDLIDVRQNHRTDEQSPAGVSLAIVAMGSGGGVVDVGDAIAAIGDTQYHVVANPYTDSANLDALEAELADRWGPIRQNEGLAIAAYSGTHANTVTLGDSRNSPHSVIVGTNLSPTTPWEYAAAVAGVVAEAASIDPARPFQTLPVLGVLGPREVDLWTHAERDTLLHEGIATTTVDSGGVVRVQMLVTTYQVNGQGAPDTAYLDANTPLTLSRLRYDVRTLLATRYARHKIADDGVRVAAGAAVVTPGLIRAEMLALFGDWEELGLVEGVEQFKADLVVERNSGDPSRVDIYMPPDLVNGLRVFGVVIGFRL